MLRGGEVRGGGRELQKAEPALPESQLNMPPNALDYISIRGFKSIASIEELYLKACNVLIGANGSGKSNFIGVFEFLRAIREGRLRRNYVIEAGGAGEGAALRVENHEGNTPSPAFHGRA